MKPRLMILFIMLIPILLWGELELTLNPGSLDWGILFGQTGRTYLQLNNPGTSSHNYSLFQVPDQLRNVQTAYYPFDGNYLDMFGCSTGTVSALPFCEDRHSRAGSAVSLNASSHYTTKDFAVENNFSVSFWAKPETAQSMYAEGYSNAPAYTNYLIGPEWGGTSNWAGFGIALGTNGIIVFEHGHAYMPRLLSYSAALSGWHHYTITFANHAPKLYIDGVFVRSGITSQRTYTRLSHDLGSYVYGYYTGSLDELCVFNSSLDQTQVNAIYAFGSNARYLISNSTGSVSPGTGFSLMLKMLDPTLPLGVYADTLIFCQGDSNPEYQLVPVNLTITDQGPLEPVAVNISKLPSGDVLLQWNPVTQDTYGMAYTPTRYRIYRSDFPGLPNTYTEIGQSTEPQFVDPYDPLFPEGAKQFYLVRAE